MLGNIEKNNRNESKRMYERKGKVETENKKVGIKKEERKKKAKKKKKKK